MNKKIKVLHINCNYASTKLHSIMINKLKFYNFDNYVFCPVAYKYKVDRVFSEKEFIVECFNNFDRFIFFRKQKKIFSNLIELLNISSFKLVHAYTLFTDGNVAYNIKKKYKIPYVVAFRSTDMEFFKYRINLRKRGIEILRNASKIFFLSSNIKEIFLNKYCSKFEREIINSKIEIIPNGIDDFWLENIYDIKKSINFDEIKILCVSQLIKRKNILLLKKATDFLKKKYNIKLIVVGAKVDLKIWKKLTIDSSVSYYEFMEKEKLIDIYRNSDIFALPSVHETFGLVYAEALSQGLPIIYTKNEGFDGQIRENIGIPSYPRLNDLKKSIEKIILEYDFFQKNCSHSVKKFSWDKIIDEYIKIYEIILYKECKNGED